MDFVPADVARESEKELLFNKRDLKVNENVDKAIREPITPEEQEILSVSAVAVDDETGK